MRDYFVVRLDHELSADHSPFGRWTDHRGGDPGAAGPGGSEV